MKFSKEEKNMWVADWKQSGKKAWAYAKENGLIPQTFCNWAKNESKKTSCFVEVPVQVKLKPEQPQVILIEKGNLRIHIPLSVWLEYPRAVMEGLQAVS
jgi:transposase-like protein